MAGDRDSQLWEAVVAKLREIKDVPVYEVSAPHPDSPLYIVFRPGTLLPPLAGSRRQAITGPTNAVYDRTFQVKAVSNSVSTLRSLTREINNKLLGAILVPGSGAIHFGFGGTVEPDDSMRPPKYTSTIAYTVSFDWKDVK